MTKVTTGVRYHSLSFLRNPVNLVLMLVIPPAVIKGFGRAMASFPELPMMSVVPADEGRILGSLFSVAFITGLIGMFQILSAERADERLVLTGFSQLSLLFSRLATIFLFCVAVSGFTLFVLQSATEPAAPVLAFGFLVLAGMIYGLLGVLIGALAPGRLEGSLVLVFAADIDGFLGSGMVSSSTTAMKLLPLHFPQALLTSAVIDGTYATEDLYPAVAYLAVLLVLVVAVFVRTAGSDAGWFQ